MRQRWHVEDDGSILVREMASTHCLLCDGFIIKINLKMLIVKLVVYIFKYLSFVRPDLFNFYYTSKFSEYNLCFTFLKIQCKSILFFIKLTCRTLR